MLFRLGDYAKAEPYIRESLRYDAKLAKAHYRLGLILEKQGNAGEAMRELTEAASLEPTYPEPQYGLAQLFRGTGEPEKAKAALKEFERRRTLRGKEPPLP